MLQGKECYLRMTSRKGSMVFLLLLLLFVSTRIFGSDYSVVENGSARENK